MGHLQVLSVSSNRFNFFAFFSISIIFISATLSISLSTSAVSKEETSLAFEPKVDLFSLLVRFLIEGFLPLFLGIFFSASSSAVFGLGFLPLFFGTFIS